MSDRDQTEKPLRILFIGKRFYTNRDAFKEGFGRIYQLPYWWARKGHDVDLWLIDYHGRERDIAEDGTLSIETTPVLRFRFFTRLIAACTRIRRARRPDVVVASGDCYVGLLAYLIARCSRARLVFDVYDRYDVYDGYRRLPGFDPLSFLLRRADISTFASAKVLEELRPLARKTVLVMNGVDLSRFGPLPMDESRASFGLPEGVPLVGYFGSMEPERGISDLIDAVAVLRKDEPDLKLIIGGKSDPAMNIDHPWVLYLGNLAFAQMPAALASCDLLALPYRQGSWVDNGSSCKIAEYIATERPIVATRSPGLVLNFPEQAARLDELLAEPGDVADLASSIRGQLAARRLVEMPKGMSWQDISETMLNALENLGASGDTD